MREQQPVPVDYAYAPRGRRVGPQVRAPLTADPACAAEVESMLRSYWSTHFGGCDVAFRKSPSENPNGWEAYTYCFELQATEDLPAEFTRPLVARIYGDPRALPRARHEFAAIEHVKEWGYPVPEPLLLEEDDQYFGGPFLIMTKMCGLPLLEALLRRPRKIFSLPGCMARTQAWLHRLPTKGFPADCEPLLQRRLEDIDDVIRVFDLPGLAPGLQWLSRRRPDNPEKPRLLHLDYHPVNLVTTCPAGLAVLDWTEADVGDVHADVGTTLMMMECMPAGETGLFKHLLVTVGRSLLCKGYLRAYRRQIPLDADKLNYYRALAAHWRLCCYGRWLRAGPEVTGAKHDSVRHLTPMHVGTLERYFLRCTGVEVQVLAG